MPVSPRVWVMLPASYMSVDGSKFCVKILELLFLS